MAGSKNRLRLSEKHKNCFVRLTKLQPELQHYSLRIQPPLRAPAACRGEAAVFAGYNSTRAKRKTTKSGEEKKSFEDHLYLLVKDRFSTTHNDGTRYRA